MAVAAQPELPAPVAYRLLRRDTISGEWKTDGRLWQDGLPSDDLKPRFDKDPDNWRIEFAYKATDLQQAVEQAKPINTESVLVDGVAYDIPAPVSAELLRLNIELLQAQAKREPVSEDDMAELISDASRAMQNSAGVKTWKQQQVFFSALLIRGTEALHNIGDRHENKAAG